MTVVQAQPPRVSAIVVFWNAAPFLREAIDSVLAQTFADWELLLVDDGSDDGGTQIALQAVATDPARIRYLEHPGHARLGISAARNLGLRHAAGRYVGLLDADDAWSPVTLAEQVEILEREPRAAFAYGPIAWWYSWTGRPEDHDRDYVEELGFSGDRLVEPPWLLERFLQDKVAVPSGLLVRRDVAERVGGFEDAFRGEYEDQVFLAKVCLEHPVWASSRCWYRYRLHDRSTVAVGMESGATDEARRVFLAWLGRYLAARSVRRAGVRWALRRERWRFSHPTAFHLLRRAERNAGRLVRRLTARPGGAT